jgi:hypothetical protein
MKIVGAKFTLLLEWKKRKQEYKGIESWRIVTKLHGVSVLA